MKWARRKDKERKTGPNGFNRRQKSGFRGLLGGEEETQQISHQRGREDGGMETMKIGTDAEKCGKNKKLFFPV